MAILVLSAHDDATYVSELLAARLGISLSTVKNHLASIFDKLGVHTRLEAVMHAQRAGWLGAGTGEHPREG